jgi:hypothetical protein
MARCLGSSLVRNPGKKQLMSWGHCFSSAWHAASTSAKRAAAAIATGTKMVERTVVHAATASAIWASEKAVQAGRWVEAEAVATARIVEIGGGNLALSAGSALDNVRRAFGPKRPQDPTVPCPFAAAGNDTHFDGCLMSYPNGQCGPITAKGTPIGPNQIAVAEANAYQSPSNCCANMRTSGAPPRTIAYVNGIRTTKEVFCQTLRAIGETTCAKVYGVYNATEGWIRDGEQTSTDRNLILQAQKGQPFRTDDGRNPAVDSMADLIAAKAFQNSRSKSGHIAKGALSQA